MPRAARSPATSLTPKQEAFCLAMFECGNGSEAYKQAYNSAKMSAIAIRVEASRLLNSPNITLRLEELRRAAAGKAVVTREAHLAQLGLMKCMALAIGDIRTAIKAEELRGRVLGFYVEKVERGKPGEFDHLSDGELELQTREALAAAVKGGFLKVVKGGKLTQPP